VANGRVNTVAEFLDHPVLAGRGRRREVESPGGVLQAPRPPADLGGVEPVMGPIPAAGEHTEAVLRALGRTDHDIAAVRDAGAIHARTVIRASRPPPASRQRGLRHVQVPAPGPSPPARTGPTSASM
jgi:hypothetical protein